jgi:hypothetical protein
MNSFELIPGLHKSFKNTASVRFTSIQFFFCFDLAYFWNKPSSLRFDFSNLWNKQTSLGFVLLNLWNKQTLLCFDLSNLWNK